MPKKDKVTKILALKSTRTRYGSAVQQALRYWRSAYGDENSKYAKKQKWKVVFHSLLAPKFALKWFEVINSYDFSDVVKSRPLLYIKPFRTYISIQWNRNKRLKVIMDSYRFMRIHSGVFNDFICHRQDLILAEIELKNGMTAHLKLGYFDQFRKEGEIVLFLDCLELGGRISSTAFSFNENNNGEWICFVGCVQGHANNDYDSAKVIQKLMHGIRPNAFIVFALQELCRQLGCERILCAGDSIHTYRQKHAIHIQKLHAIDFDYDKFWQESLAEPVEDGWYQLPLQAERREMKDLKPKRRASYRKRYAMLDEVSISIAYKVRSTDQILRDGSSHY